MYIEVIIAKTSPLPADAIDVLAGELSRHTQRRFPDNKDSVTARHAGADSLSITDATKEGEERAGEIPQETWESVDDWFISE